MNKMNKTAKVLKHLKDHGSITSWESITKYRATRLSAIIFNLKSYGYDIRTVRMESENEDNELVRYAKYVLLEENRNGKKL